MRRRLPPGDGVPPHLATFTESDWPGRTWEDRYRLWRAARRAWGEPGDRWPGGAVERILGEMDVRDIHWYGAPHRSRPREVPTVHQD